MRYNRIILFALFTSLLTHCSTNQKSKEEHQYLPLSEYKYKPASLPGNSEVEVLAFSGGKRTDSDYDVYYYQFMVLNKATGDTVRILSPLIRFFDSAYLGNTGAAPLHYKLEKGITSAVYKLSDSTTNDLFMTNVLIERHNLDTAADPASLKKGIVLKPFVVINKQEPMFEDPAYATAIGVLEFKTKPY